jgi:nicotinate-nucleotide adenylyltransferase
MRVGLFGGTFNPIHIGHLRAASEVAEEFNLEKVYLIPTFFPPHKEIHGIAPPENRLEMTRLASEGNPVFGVSDVELKRSGVSYTIDTVKYFRRVFSKQDVLYLIMGMDAFLEVDTWKSFKELFQLIPMIIMERPVMNGCGHSLKCSLLEFIRDKISDGYQYNASNKNYCHSALHTIYHFKVSLLDISGTKIRDLLRKRKSIRFLVPESVETYIYKKGLYV